MLHLFHGDNIDASRKELQKFKEKYADKEIISFAGKNVSLTELKQATEAASLFGLEKLILVENLFSQKLSRKSSEMDIYKNFLVNLPKTGEIVFWEEKELSKTLINLLPRTADIALFQLDRVLFKFLESLRPNATAELIDKYDNCLLKESPEMIFAMLIRQFRYLIMVKDMGKNLTELTPWQIAKFVKQISYFDMKKLTELYKKLLEIDLRVKTSNSAFNLTDEIRLFLINI